jgi:V/A-type H+/Na+-transporting ATPase subunit E
VNGLEAILQSIGEEAREKARSIREQAEAGAAEQLARARREAAALLEAAEKQAQRQAEEIRHRAAGTAALENRKTLLAARRKMVDDVLSGVTRHLAGMDETAKSVWYERLLAENARGTEQVIFCAADRALAGPLIARLNRANGWQLTVADETGGFSSGLVLNEGLVQVNLSTEMLLRSRRPELVAAAARTLFDE